jgi:prepilin-type N-terminal cleavage/methylation domain-containing protein
MTRRGDGFTLVELAIVLVILGVIAAVAIPSYVNLLRDTRAMQAVADLYAVRAAAYLNYGDTARWPIEAPAGVPPLEIAERLPPDFRFVREHYRIDWENWIGAPRRSGDPRIGIEVGVSIVTRDTKLLEAVEGLLSKYYTSRTAPTKTTMQIAGPGGI